MNPLPCRAMPMAQSQKSNTRSWDPEARPNFRPGEYSSATETYEMAEYYKSCSSAGPPPVLKI